MSSTSFVPIGSNWNVALHWRRQYSLGAQFRQVAEAVLKLEIHTVQRIGEPAGTALAERHAQARIALEHARPHSPR
jgi:hypothetical protein